MNLSEALDAALPEMPKTRLARSRPPCLDPDLIVREDTVNGEPIVGVLKREKNDFYRLTPSQWQMVQLFDGVRSYEEIAAMYTEQTGAPIASEDLQGFAEIMEQEDFWYKTPQEKNLAMSQKLMNRRGRVAGRKSKINLAHMTFSGWDPDRYLTWLDNAIGKAVYSPWSVLAAVLLFAFEASVFVTKWSILGPDTALYYNFTQKTLVDFLQFYLLFLALGFIHESAHGLTCKHYGGQVHSMGLMFVYLMPAFFVDVTEIWVSASKVQRLATIIAGIWVEMMMCGLAMIAWMNTLPGQWMHNFSYQVILITGIMVVVLNLNPLIKLDGYYFLTELIGMPALKEQSTAFLSGWFQSRVLRLQVEVPVVTRKRAPFFILYAIVSGIYSYTLLFFVVRLSYNVTSKWLAEFALIPAAGLAFLMFRSRLRALRGVGMRVWERNFGADRPGRRLRILVVAALAMLLFVPIWRDRESAFFVIEPQHSYTVHAAVPGKVTSVSVQEGESVHAGQRLLRMSSLSAASMQSSATAQTGSARYQAYTAQVNGQSIGTAAAEQSGAERFAALASDAQSSLVVTAPADGIVLTHNPGLLVDQDIASGQMLLELADPGPRMVRIFVPSSALDQIPAGAEVSLVLPDRFSVIRITLAAPGADAKSLPPGLAPNQNFKGIKMPVYYSSRMVMPASAGDPLFGISGKAKIFGRRYSIAGRIAISIMNLLKAHVW